MGLIPFFGKRYVSDLGLEKVRCALVASLSAPEEGFSFQKSIATTTEGEVHSDRFRVVVHKYGLTWGRTSLLPFMIGRFRALPDGRTELQIRIQPSLGIGAAVLAIVYLLCVWGFYHAVQNNEIGAAFVCALLIFVTYLSVLIRFHADKRLLLDFLHETLALQVGS